MAKRFASTYPDFCAAAFFAGTLVVAFFPFLFGEKIFINVDATLYYYPVFDFYADALKSGESFLWNPSLFSGFPTYLSQSAGFFDPVNLLLFWQFDSFDAYHIRLYIDLLLVMVFSHLAARSLGFSWLASLLVGAGYLTAFHWGYLSNLVIANSLFLTPFLFWIVIRMPERGIRAYAWSLFAGVGIGWSLLSGYAQFTVYASMLFALALFLERSYVRSQRSLGSFFSTVGQLSLAAIVAGIIALPQLVPALDFTPLTVRAGGLAYGLTTAKVITLGDLALFLFPDYMYFPYITAGRRPLYIGALLFLLAVIGIGSLLRRLWQQRFKVAEGDKRLAVLLGLFVFCLAAAAAHSPVFYVLHKLPILSYFRFPYRWMYIGIWFLALLGAYGFDSVRYGSREKWQAVFATLVACGTAVFVLFVVALNFLGEQFWGSAARAINFLLGAAVYGRMGFMKDPAHYQDAIRRGIEAWQESLSLTDPAFAVAFMVLLTGAGIIFMAVHRHISQERFALFGFLLCAATFPLITAVQWKNTLPRDMTESYAELMERIPRLDKEQYRAFPFMLSADFSRQVPPQYTLSTNEEQALGELQFSSGWPNMNQYSGIMSVDGYDPFVPTNILAALERSGSTHGGEEATKRLSAAEKEERLANNVPLIGMMSGKYIVSGTPLRVHGLTEILSMPVTRFDALVYVYDNSFAVPRVRYAQAIRNAPGASLLSLVEADNDFVATTFLDCADCVGSPPNAHDTFKILDEQNGFIHIKTMAAGNRWLVVGESFLPGWQAQLDGKPVTITRANGLYLAVEVPAGEHELILQYVGVRNELRWLRLFGIVRD